MYRTPTMCRAFAGRKVWVEPLFLTAYKLFQGDKTNIQIILTWENKQAISCSEDSQTGEAISSWEISEKPSGGQSYLRWNLKDV